MTNRPAKTQFESVFPSSDRIKKSAFNTNFMNNHNKTLN